MIHFTYHAPTKVVFQQEGELLCAQLLQEFGAHKVTAGKVRCAMGCCIEFVSVCKRQSFLM